MTTDRPVVRPAPAQPVTPTGHRSAAGTTAGSADGTGWAVLTTVGIVGFLLLSVLVASQTSIPFDRTGLDFARALGVAPIVWSALSESANIPLIVIGVAIIAWLLLTHRRREALLVFLMLAAITAGSEGVKQLVARPRPSGTDPNIPGVVYSYPSGHVLEALTILGILTIRGWRTRRPLILRALFVIVVAAWVALVGLARVGLAAHYPSDVLAGILGGAAALGIYGWVTRRSAAAAQQRRTATDEPRDPTGGHA